MTWLFKWLFPGDDLPPAAEADRAVNCAEMPWYADLISGKALPFPDAQGGFGSDTPANHKISA